MEEIEMGNMTRENFNIFMAEFVGSNKHTKKMVAKAIGCSEMTVKRLIAGISYPTDEMLKQSGIMFELGLKRYSKLTQSEKERISESIGTIGAGILGFGSISAAISSLGVAGLSAAGITSGLGALGTIVGGGMVAGVTVAATIPIAAGLAGYGIIKLIKASFGEIAVNQKDVDSMWEIIPEIE